MLDVYVCALHIYMHVLVVTKLLQCIETADKWDAYPLLSTQLVSVNLTEQSNQLCILLPYVGYVILRMQQELQKR